MNLIPVIIETPKGSNEKYNYDKKFKCFKLSKVLPTGMVFPYDFGYIPNTKGGDGDPVDAVVISEFKSFPGCLMECRIIGILIAEQIENKKKVRNDRVLFIPEKSVVFQKIESIHQFPNDHIQQLKNFFVNYNNAEGKIFKPLELLNEKESYKLLKKILR